MYIKVKVTPESKHDKIEQVKSDEYRICVKVSAENNKANLRVLEMLRDHFPNKRIHLVSGHRSPSKILSVER